MLATPAGVYAIGLVQKPASTLVVLATGILTYWGSGRWAPRLPPRGRLVPPGSGVVVFCVRPPPSRGCVRVLDVYSEGRCGYPCWLKLYSIEVLAQVEISTGLRHQQKLV